MTSSRLEEYARAFVPGTGPVSIEQSVAGLVNDSCRVRRDGLWYALRAASAPGPPLGLERDWECKVLAHAGKAGLAPRVRRCEPALGILVADWVTGRSWTPAETALPGSLATMARLLRRVHELPIPAPARVMDPASWIALYRSAGANGRWSAPLHAAADACVAAISCATPGVLCHSDLHRHNLCVGASLWLLDWEYAHVADPYWDLAGWTANNDGTPEFAARLLAEYLGRDASPAEAARLRVYRWLYEYVCLLWSELHLGARDGQLFDPGDAAARAAHLARRLHFTPADGDIASRAGWQLPAH